MCAFCRVNHSKNAIVKPASKSSDKDRKDVDKAMRRVKEASSIIEDEIDPGMSHCLVLVWFKSNYTNAMVLIRESVCGNKRSTS